MKRYIVLVVLFVSGMVFAQESKPVLEQEGSMVKATYFYATGQVQQVGFFKDGKLEGTWVSYDEKGNKVAVAEYKSGEKVGKWFFWNERAVTEVNYDEGAISSVRNLTRETLAKN